MERSVIDVLVSLGRRLEALSGASRSSATTSREVSSHAFDNLIDRAVRANPWFTAADICRSAAAIAEDMLTHPALENWLAAYPDLSVPTPSQDTSTGTQRSDASPAPKNILIIMAGNIPFVGMQDLVCVLAAGHRAIVKPSSKDAVLMSWVVEQLLDIAPDLPVSLAENGEGLGGEKVPEVPEAVIAMGSTDTMRAIREKHPDVPTLLRGSRSSLAVLGRDDDASGTPAVTENKTFAEPDPKLAALADDVLSFSGLGCRNVSLVFVPRGYELTPLQEALKAYSPTEHSGGYLQARALARMNGTPHIDCGTCIMVEERDFSTSPGVLNYTFFDSGDEVVDWIAAHDAEIQCVATDMNLDAATKRSVGGSIDRIVPLGRTQRPTLDDYPDGHDTMQFLMSLCV